MKDSAARRDTAAHLHQAALVPQVLYQVRVRRQHDFVPEEGEAASLPLWLGLGGACAFEFRQSTSATRAAASETLQQIPRSSSVTVERCSETLVLALSA